MKKLIFTLTFILTFGGINLNAQTYTAERYELSKPNYMFGNSIELFKDINTGNEGVSFWANTFEILRLGYECNFYSTVNISENSDLKH